MKNIDLSNYEFVEFDGVFVIKNLNTTVSFLRFNIKGEVEYIFVNPIFRRKGLAKKLLSILKKKTGKKVVFQKPISPMGLKLLKSL